MIVLALISLLLAMEVSCFLTEKNLFKNEICSYNGIPVTKTSTDSTTSIECKCQKEYATLKLKRTIFGNTIFCNYLKKSRLTALFLSITLPFGFDYLYLGRIGVFIVVLLFTLLAFIGNCYIFAQTERRNNTNSEIELKKSRNPWAISFIILAVAWLVFTIINVSLMSNGLITDINGIETYDDLSNLSNDIFITE